MDAEFRNGKEVGYFPSLAALRRSRRSFATFVAACEAGLDESEDELLDEAAVCLARCLALFGA